MIQRTERQAKLPNLDGLYGGKACVTHDGFKLTKYPPPEDYDEESKQHYGAVEELEELGACDLQICRYVPIDGPDPGIVTKDCLSIWTKWSPWGKCDKECGPSGKRIRTR